MTIFANIDLANEDLTRITTMASESDDARAFVSSVYGGWHISGPTASLRVLAGLLAEAADKADAATGRHPAVTG